MENVQYKKYEDRIKKQCIVKLISYGLALIAILLVAFVPFLNQSVDLDDFSIIVSKTSLAGLLKALLSFTISLNVTNIIFIVFIVFECVVALYFAIGFVKVIIESVKNIINLTHLDTYVLQTYDELKKSDEKATKKMLRLYGIKGLLTSAFLMQFIATLMIFFMMYYNRDIATELVRYIGNISTNTLIILPVIFVVAIVILTIISDSMRKKIRLDILKDDYHVQSDTPAA